MLVVLKPKLCEALMTNEELLRERVAKLEVQMSHLNEKLDDTHKKVEEMHAILLQAKGARWVIVGLAGVAGLASGLLAKLIPQASQYRSSNKTRELFSLTQRTYPSQEPRTTAAQIEHPSVNTQLTPSVVPW